MSIEFPANASIDRALQAADAAGASRNAEPAIDPLVRPESLQRILQDAHASDLFAGRAFSTPTVGKPRVAQDRYEVVAERQDFDPRGSAGPADLTLYRDTADRDGKTYLLHIEARWLVDLQPLEGDDAWTIQAGHKYIKQSLPQSVDQLFDGLVLRLDNGAVVELEVDIETKLQEVTGSWIDRWLADRLDSFVEQERIDLVNATREPDEWPHNTLFRSDMPEPVIGGVPDDARFPEDARGLAEFVAGELLGLHEAGYTDLVRYSDAVEMQQREENRLKPVPDMPPALAEELAPFLRWVERSGATED